MLPTMSVKIGNILKNLYLVKITLKNSEIFLHTLAYLRLLYGLSFRIQFENKFLPDICSLTIRHLKNKDLRE